MSSREQIVDVFADVISKILEKNKDEILLNLDAKFKEDLNMTSLEYFPLIGTLEEKFDIEIDYHDFLTNALTSNDGIDFVLEIIGSK